MATIDWPEPQMRKQPRYCLVLNGRPALERGVWRRRDLADHNAALLREKLAGSRRAVVTVRRVWVGF